MLDELYKSPNIGTLDCVSVSVGASSLDASSAKARLSSDKPLKRSHISVEGVNTFELSRNTAVCSNGIGAVFCRQEKEYAIAPYEKMLPNESNLLVFSTSGAGSWACPNGLYCGMVQENRCDL